MMQFGAALRTVRKMLGISLVNFAKASGFDQGRVSKWENDLADARLKTARELAEAYDLPLFVIVALAEEEDVRHRWPEWGLALREVQNGVAQRVARHHQEEARKAISGQQGRARPRLNRL